MRQSFCDAGEEGRLDEPALVEPGGATAADGDGGAFLLADLEVALDPLALALGDERPDLGGGVGGIADLHGADRGRERLVDLGLAAAGHEDAGLGEAGLAVVHDGAGEQHRDGLVEVGVVEHDGGRLAAELERARA